MLEVMNPVRDRVEHEVLLDDISPVDLDSRAGVAVCALRGARTVAGALLDLADAIREHTASMEKNASRRI